MHGGVRVESSPDGGARFVLSLPVLANGDEPDDGSWSEDSVVTTSRVRRLLRRPLAALVLLPLAAVAAGCAIPTQSTPSSIAPSRVPFSLLDPHPPTTTTTQPKASSYVGVKVFFLNANANNTLTPVDRLVERAGAVGQHHHRARHRPDER